MENIDWQDLLFKFDGRINRAKFWIGNLVLFAIYFVFVSLALILNSALGWGIFLVSFVAIVWISFAVAIKRWHDRGKSGWWVLIGVVPLVGPLWMFIETGFLEGDRGDNQYGADPLAA